MLCIASKMFYVHAQKSEPAQYTLLFYFGWKGVSMPIERCSVHMPIVINYFKVRGVKQNSVPYMMKILLTHIPIECGVVDPNVYRFLNSSG